MISKEDLIEKLFERGILVNKELIENGLDKNILKELNLNEEDLSIFKKEDLGINKNYNIVYSYDTTPQKYVVKDFANVFKYRYKFLESILRNKPKLKGITTIQRVLQKRERDKVSIIGLVNDIAETKNGNLLITLEDITGTIKVLINKNNPDLLEESKSLIFDEVIGITGSNGDKIIFADDVIWPDTPTTKEIKKSPNEEYAIFLSDIHVGSKYFLEDSFNKLIKWINGEVGNENQKDIANKIKYIFIAGDVVDGIGIYKDQDQELSIKSIYGQYDAFADLINKISKEKNIFICPGNHDMVHLAEPQPAFYKKYAQKLYNMDNVELVSNPSMINIGKTDNFEGTDVLMYHGYSFDFYVANVDSIRNNGGYERADLIMKFLLKRRHLAPAFKSTPYLPFDKDDPLLIKKIPDIMITGHIHYSSIANYNGITLMSGSCWQGKTKFQEKLGHNPQPGRVPVINLKTRKIKVMKFV